MLPASYCWPPKKTPFQNCHCFARSIYVNGISLLLFGCGKFTAAFSHWHGIKLIYSINTCIMRPATQCDQACKSEVNATSALFCQSDSVSAPGFLCLLENRTIRARHDNLSKKWREVCKYCHNIYFVFHLELNLPAWALMQSHFDSLLFVMSHIHIAFFHNTNIIRL